MLILQHRREWRDKRLAAFAKLKKELKEEEAGGQQAPKTGTASEFVVAGTFGKCLSTGILAKFCILFSDVQCSVGLLQGMYKIWLNLCQTDF